MKRAGSPGSVARKVQTGESTSAWHLAEEVAVGIQLNSVSLAVMMATPVDLEELAIGFVIAEGHAAPDRITAALAFPTEGGFVVDVAAPGVIVTARTRRLEGRSGCGLCGMEDLTDVRRAMVHRIRPAPDPAAVLRGFDRLEHHQPIRAVNRSVHAAGLIDAAGDVLMAYEDVGRHCALDKLIGGMAAQGIAPDSGVAVMTSRCSFELVQKAATAGLAGLATRSAPTALAVDLAREAGLPLFCRQGSTVVVF